MKKLKVLLAAAAVAVSSSAFAQDLSFGVKAGLNIASVSAKYGGKKITDAKSLLGINLGVYADYGFSDMLAWKPVCNLSKKVIKQNKEK